MTVLTEGMVKCKTNGSALTSIRKLNCWGSDLTDVSILRRMPNVQVITLSVNNISTLEDFAYCPNLEELYVRRNNIADLTEILYLKKCSRLRFLWLADNPCAQGDQYRFTVLRALPHLQKLDNIDVDHEEVQEAIRSGQELSEDDLRPGWEEDLKRTTERIVIDTTRQPKTCIAMKSINLSAASETQHGHSSTCAKEDSNNVLQAVLWLIEELDMASLDILQERIYRRKNMLQDKL